MNTENSTLENDSEFSQLENDEIIHVKKMPRSRNLYEDDKKRQILELNDATEDHSQNRMHDNVTNQYLKFVNAHLAEKLNLVEKLYLIKNNLEKEIELLKSDDLTDMIALPNMSINHLNPSEVSEIDTFMKLQRSLTKSKIDYYKNKLEDAETELQENQLEINEFNEEDSQEPIISESDKLVKDELEFLIKKYGMKELTYAIDVITSSKIIKENQNLE